VEAGAGYRGFYGVDSQGRRRGAPREKLREKFRKRWNLNRGNWKISLPGWRAYQFFFCVTDDSLLHTRLGLFSSTSVHWTGSTRVPAGFMTSLSMEYSNRGC
jgi:hypothetical protein